MSDIVRLSSGGKNHHQCSSVGQSGTVVSDLCPLPMCTLFFLFQDVVTPFQNVYGSNRAEVLKKNWGDA